MKQAQTLRLKIDIDGSKKCWKGNTTMAEILTVTMKDEKNLRQRREMPRKISELIVRYRYILVIT